MEGFQNGLINDGHYKQRYVKMLVEQIKMDHAEYKQLLEKKKNKILSMEEEQELGRALSYLKKELRVLEQMRSGIEGVLFGEIKDIENDLENNSTGCVGDYVPYAPTLPSRGKWREKRKIVVSADKNKGMRADAE